jgi:hypothetical protein
LRVNFKSFPTAPNPSHPGVDRIWWPVLNVVLFYHHIHTRPIESIVDSGCQACLFHADIGSALGIDVTRGAESPLTGAIGGVGGKVYYHKVRMLVAGENLEIIAGFSPQLSVAGLLGQLGFFDNFVVTMDYTPDPPLLELHRIFKN